MLRRVLGIKLLDKVTNADLYARCGIQPASIQIVNVRWRLFGHTLRMNERTPARKAMAYYFVNDHDGRTGKRVTKATALSDEYKAVKGTDIKSLDEYDSIVRLATDRDVWKQLVKEVTDTFVDKYEGRVKRKKELREEVKANKRRRVA